MANWWDTLGTGIGDSLIGMQTPFGMSPPNLDPAQRQAMIANSLITLGGNIAGSGKNPAVGLARGVSQLQQNAGENMARGAYFQQLQDTATERKAQKEAQNRTREWAKTQPWAKDYPIDSMSGDDLFRVAVGANKPPDMPSSVQEFQYAQQHPEFAQFLQQGKGGDKSRTTKTSVAGRDVLLDLNTGQILQDYGPSETRQQTVPQAVQGDAIRAEQAYRNLNQALDNYEGLVTKTSSIGATLSGPSKDAIDLERRNIQMQAKELYNLGVLNGPDLQLMNEMIYDPSISVLNPVDMASKLTGGNKERGPASIARFRQILKNIRDNKLNVVNEYRATAGASPAAEPPADVDPALWQAMTPEEQALWQTSQ